MKKLVFAGAFALLFSFSVGVDNSFGDTQGYERVEEECSRGGFQIRCRWNDAARCNVSAQTSCSEIAPGIG